jgi:Fe-S cluster biogenesis protein NfuA
VIEIDKAPDDSDTCVLRIDRAVTRTPEYYSSAEEAASSPLGKRLLAIRGLDAVLLQDHTVTLLKPVPGEPWKRIAAEAERVLLDHFAEVDRVRAAAAREMTAGERDLFFEVQSLLNEEINPMVASHGGYIEVMDVKDFDLYVSMGGGCQGCGMAAVTLRQGVEQLIRQHIPEVRNIFDATDHTAGENPYYSAER